MREEGWHVGIGQRQNPFLCIPLCAQLHVGDQGIDGGTGVLTWERMYGRQMNHLRALNICFDYDLFEQANSWEERVRWKSKRSSA